MTGSSVRKRLLIKGRVQGVGFRANTQREAARIGDLKGWVRNLANGDVEVLVQGTSDAVESLVQWCHQGPRLARVDEVNVREEDVGDDLGEFGIG